MRQIIGITGKARTGKDTVAAFLWKHYGFTRLAFADPLKIAAQAIFGLSDEYTWKDDHKESLIPYWGLSPRQIFQRLGTECVKPVFGNEVWIKRLAISLTTLPEDNIVIPDVRFEEEAHFIRSSGGRIIHLHRGDAPKVNAHCSENGILFQDQDLRIDNNGTVEDLHAALANLLEGTD